jgi:hypothetical protein
MPLLLDFGAAAFCCRLVTKLDVYGRHYDDSLMLLIACNLWLCGATGAHAAGTVLQWMWPAAVPHAGV